MTLSTEPKTLRQGLADLAATTALRSVDWAMQVPRIRGYVLERMLRRLGDSHRTWETDGDKLMHDLWLGRQLRPWLDRLIEQRPAAFRAILRFIATWSADIRRRSEISSSSGRVSPCTVVIEPTDRCNLSCPGCYAKSFRTGSDLPFERLQQVVEQVIDMGVTLITLSGGEPFLREREDQAITRLARRFRDRGFLVYTNGTLIDERIADRLAEVGNVFPAISVEGYEHQTDARRGAGIYEQNRQARRMLADRGVMCGFSATITSENARAICTDDFIDLRVAEGDMFGWFFLLQPIGRSPRVDLMATADQRALLRDTIYRWRAEQRPIFLGDFWNDGHLVGGCIAGGRSYFHIYANGDISPCVFSPVACGNIFEIIAGRSQYGSLDDFVQRHPVFARFRQAQNTISDRNSPCLLIDHPELFRDIAKLDGCRPAKNMSEGYLDGEIATAVDRVAAQWSRQTASLPPLPAEAERTEKLRSPVPQ